MSSEPPRPGAVPGWGTQPSSEPPAMPAAEPPPAPDAPATAAPGGAIPGWGAPGPTSPAPGGPVPAAPPASVWGAVPPAPPPPGGQPGWGAPGGSPPAPGGNPPGGWSPQPAQPSGSSGCLKILLVLVVVAVIGFAVLVAALVFIGNQIASSVGVSSDGSVGTPCPYISDAELGDALGGKAEALVLDGLWDATVGIILDKRVLPTADDCWITSDETTPTGRIAVYRGSDAAAVFAQERQNAAPTSEDQGGGISLENSGYFGGDVAGLGDEAFCTGVSAAIQAGVLVRQGDRVVYVSLSGPADGAPDLGSTEDGVITAPSVCAAAQEVARSILE